MCYITLSFVVNLIHEPSSTHTRPVERTKMASHSVSLPPSRLVFSSADSPASIQNFKASTCRGFLLHLRKRPPPRSQILGLPCTLLQQGTYIQTDSPSNSSSRGRWNRLQRWDGFSDLVEMFWVNLSEEEKNTVIFAFPFQFVTNYRTTSIGNLPRPTNESMIYSHIDLEYVNTHKDVSTQLPLSCHHAKISMAIKDIALWAYPTTCLLMKVRALCLVSWK